MPIECKFLGPHDYDEVGRCPFCGQANLAGDEHCEHLVAAFQSGVWAADLCPPVNCDGFQFNEEQLLAALSKIAGVICKDKPGTSRHPRIRAYFCANPRVVRELRTRHRQVPTRGAACAWCGNEYVVLDVHDEPICSRCGQHTYWEELEC